MHHAVFLVVTGFADFARLYGQDGMKLFIVLLLLGFAEDAIAVWLCALNVALTALV